MKKSDAKGVLMRVAKRWAEFEPKTKLMAVGTFALIAVSIFLSTGNVIDGFFGEKRAPAQPANIVSEEEGLIPEDAEPIPFASEETQLVASLMAILANEECAWVAVDDPICAIGFTPQGFDEYTGDIKASHALEFYSVEVTQNGRSGVWRVTHPDGTVHDARFTFEQDTERGVLVLSSSALPHEVYESPAFTSGDLRTW